MGRSPKTAMEIIKFNSIAVTILSKSLSPIDDAPFLLSEKDWENTRARLALRSPLSWEAEQQRANRRLKQNEVSWTPP